MRYRIRLLYSKQKYASWRQANILLFLDIYISCWSCLVLKGQCPKNCVIHDDYKFVFSHPVELIFLEDFILSTYLLV